MGPLKLYAECDFYMVNYFLLPVALYYHFCVAYFSFHAVILFAFTTFLVILLLCNLNPEMVLFDSMHLNYDCPSK